MLPFAAIFVRFGLLMYGAAIALFILFDAC